MSARTIAIAVALAGTLSAWPALPHDSWISHGKFRNGAGEWCCGEGDCALIDKEAVSETAGGYRLRGWGTIFGGSHFGNRRIQVDETVPFSEGQPSPDGEFWRCQRPDGSRRCFFSPPPGS